MRRQIRSTDDKGNRCAALRLARRALLGTTALQAGFALAFALPSAALLAPTPATAQPAPNARPQGGTVVAGQASIARQPDTTRITQSSDRAAIDWRSFDIGRDQRVVFQQPGAGSMTLNRVTGPNPSEIAGRIQANGGVVVINGAGVVFHRGAQVEAQSFIASTADTTNAAFMAGRLHFDRPGRPGARIENHGDITVRDTGLAALVAPGVANSGMIRARLGTVVLAGAETHTIDLHGDGLVAFDVTGQVRTAPAGGAVQALVTNSGLVIAEGGTVLMTARAADGLVQQLVSAGGTIRADSVGDRTGRIEISGVGGGIRVHGTVAAEGTRPGERGGVVVVNAPAGEVTLGGTARIVASGQAGGGTVAIGTSAARAIAQGGGVPATGTARRVEVGVGARVEADATGRGNGGRVALLATDRVAHAGKISARGGPKGGDGGRVEISSARGFSLTGGVDTMAPEGQQGVLLIDPLNLRIVVSDVGEATPNGSSPQIAADGNPDAATSATLSVGTVVTLLNDNDVRLEATQNLTVDAPISFSTNSNSLTLAAGNTVEVKAAIDLKGDVVLLASAPGISGTGATTSGSVIVNAAVTSSEGAVFMRANGSGSIQFGDDGAASAGTRLSLVADALTLATKAGPLTAPTVEIAPHSPIGMNLGTGASGGLAIETLAAVTAGSLLRLGAATVPGDSLPTTLASAITFVGALAIPATALDLRAGGAVSQTAAVNFGGVTLTGQAGSFDLSNTANAIPALGDIAATAGNLSIVSAGSLDVFGAATAAGTLTGQAMLQAASTLTVASGGEVRANAVTLKAGATGINIQGTVNANVGTAPTLTVQTSGALAGTGAANTGRLSGNADSIDLGGEIASLGALDVERDIALRLSGAVVVTGPVRAGLHATKGGNIALTATADISLEGNLQAKAGTLSPGNISLKTTGGDVTHSAGTVTAATLQVLSTGNFAAPSGAVLTADRLEGIVGGNISLDTPGGPHAVTKLGDLKATGTLAYRGVGAVMVDGTVEGGASATLSISAGTTLTVLTGRSVMAKAVALDAGTGGIALDGAVKATGTLTLTTPGAVSGAGAVTAATLDGTVGSLALGSVTAADITTIGSLTSQGGFDLRASGPLTVSGTLAAAQGVDGDVSIALATGALRVNGGVVTGTTGGMTRGAIALSGPGGVTLNGAVEARSAVGTTGNVTVTSASGAVSQTGGTVTAAGALTLSAATGISQTGGIMVAPILNATTTKADAAISLPGLNRFDTLNAITAAGNLTVNNAIALTVGDVSAGLVSTAPAMVEITSAGPMNLNGAIAAGPAAAGTLRLRSNDGVASTGGLTVQPTATLSATRVELTATSATKAEGVVVIDRALSVLTGGTFELSGNTVRVGGPSLNGALSAPSGRIAISADGLVLDGSAPVVLSATGGTVALAPRVGATGADARISLGAAGDGLDLSAAALGKISAGTLEVGRSGDGGDVTLRASVTITPGTTLRVLGKGNLDALTGAILTADRLEGTVGGNIALDTPGGSHAVTKLGDLKATGSLAYRGVGDVTVDGAVGGGASTILISGAGATLTVLATKGSVAADSGGVVTLVTDLISLAGPITASGAGGRIEILPVTAGRDMTLGAAGGLSLLQSDINQLSTTTLLLGARDGGPAVAGNLSVAGKMDLTGRADRLRLLIQGNATDLGDTTGITVNRFGDAAPISGVNAASLALLSSGNDIGRIDAFATTNGFALVSASPLTVAGPVTAGADIAITSLAAGPAALDVSGSIAGGTTSAGIASGTAGDVTLKAQAGALTVAGTGSVTARNGFVSITGATDPSLGRVTIAAGATVTAGTAATINADDGLTIGGTVRALGGDLTVNAAPGGANSFDVMAGGTIESSANININATGEVLLNGAVTATAGNLVLATDAPTGSVSGTGAVRVMAVKGSAASLALTGTANEIAALDTLTIGALGVTPPLGHGGIQVKSTTNLAVLNMVAVLSPADTAPVALAVTAPVLTVTGTLSAPGQAVTLTAANGISATGQVIADTLTGTSGTGAATFSNAGNQIAKLSDFTAGDTFTLVDSVDLNVLGQLKAPNAISIATTHGLTVSVKTKGADIVNTIHASDLVAGDVTLSGAAVVMNGVVTAGHDVKVKAIGGDISMSDIATVKAGRDATLDALGTILISGLVEAVSGTATVKAFAGAEVTRTGQVKAGSDAILTAENFNIFVEGRVEASNDVALKAARAISILDPFGSKIGTIVAGGAAVLRAEGGNLSNAGIIRGGATVVLATGPETATPVPGMPVADRDIIVASTGSITAGPASPTPITAGTTLTLTALGEINSAGVLRAEALTIKAGGSAVMIAANLLTKLDTSAAGGRLILKNTGPLTVIGAVSASDYVFLNVAGAVTLDAPSATVLSAPNLTLSATSIAQTAGIVSTAALDATATTGAIALGVADNQISSLKASAATTLTLVTNTGLTLTGPATAGGASSITATGALTVPGGTSATAGTTLVLKGSDLALSGTVAAPTVALTATTGDIAQDAGSIAWTNTATLNAANAIRQTGGALLGTPAGLLTGFAGGALSLTAPGNTIPRLGPLSAGNGLALTTLGDLSVVGGLSAGAGVLALTSSGALTLGAVPLSGAAAKLDAGGPLLQQAGGTLAVTGALDLSSRGSIALNGGITAATAAIAAADLLSQGSGGSLATSGPLAITAGADISLNGSVSGNPVRLTAGRAIGQAASGALTTGTLFLSAGTDATLAGALAADLVTGAAGGALVLDGTTTRIALLRDIAAGTSIVVKNDTALGVEGRIAAPSIIVHSTGPLRIGTVALATGGVPFVEPLPGPVVFTRLPEPMTGTPGAVFETGSAALDIGTLTVTPLGGENATLALRLPTSGGTLTIARQTLDAPTTDVTFDLGTGGRATGRIEVRNLTVLGGGGGTDLEGSVRGFNGQAAASVAAIGPRQQPEYQINNCPVGSVSCVLLIVQIPVTTDPLRELGVVTTRDDRDDPDISIPNVAERDF